MNIKRCINKKSKEDTRVGSQILPISYGKYERKSYPDGHCLGESKKNRPLR